MLARVPLGDQVLEPQILLAFFDLRFDLSDLLPPLLLLPAEFGLSLTLRLLESLLFLLEHFESLHVCFVEIILNFGVLDDRGVVVQLVLQLVLLLRQIQCRRCLVVLLPALELLQYLLVVDVVLLQGPPQSFQVLVHLGYLALALAELFRIELVFAEELNQ